MKTVSHTTYRRLWDDRWLMNLTESENKRYCLNWDSLLQYVRHKSHWRIPSVPVKIRSGHSSNTSLAGRRNFSAIVVPYMRPLLSEKMKQTWGKKHTLRYFSLLLSLKTLYQLLNIYVNRRGQSNFEYTEEGLYKLITGRVWVSNHNISTWWHTRSKTADMLPVLRQRI